MDVPSKEADMADRPQPVPERLHTITPRLVFKRGAEAIAFYKAAFGAVEPGPRFSGPNGEVIHAEIQFGDSIVFITDEGDDGKGEGVAPETAGGMVTTVMALNVPNVDEVWEQALNAGCEVIYPLADQFYGDRGGRLRDPFGHQWMLSTHIEDVDDDEMMRRMAAMSAE
jgi:PhnB protein